MKKCPYCGLENPDDFNKCQTCQTDLDAMASPPPDLKRFKRFLPYILSYLIVTTAGFVYNHAVAQYHGTSFPPHLILLNTSLSTDELAAKLAQVGLPRDSVVGEPYHVSLGWTLFHYFAIYAIMFFAFAVLISSFKRVFKAKSEPPKP